MGGGGGWGNDQGAKIERKQPAAKQLAVWG